MIQWHDVLQRALDHGAQRPDRTGHGTLSLFGEQLRFCNGYDFPAVTTKRLAFAQVVAELSCFLAGSSSLAEFHDRGCRIWDANAEAPYWLSRRKYDGDLGRIYGVQWRQWYSHRPNSNVPRMTDQLWELCEGLRLDPFGRRHLVTAWNPGELDDVCLPPCHVLFQCYVREAADGLTLDLRVDMRSVDLFLGLPFNIASYALLQRLLAKRLSWHSGELVFHLGDAHLYLNHLEQARTVLKHDPKPLPQLHLAPDADLFTFELGQAVLINYSSYGPVTAKMNV